MSEKLYALLLRLYPARFRAAYGDEAMQVFRDRLRDDRGFRARVRLWLDVLLDLVRSMPQEHRRAAAVAAISVPRAPGVPSFYMLEDETPRPGSFVFGAALALAGLGTFAFLLGHGGNTQIFGAASYSAMQGGVSPSGGGSAAAPPPPAPVASELDAAEQHRVIQAIVAEMTGPCRHASGAGAIVQALTAREAAGDYVQIGEGDIFASALTTQMHAITSDPEVSIFFTANGKSREPEGAQRIDKRFAMTIRESRRGR